MRCLLVNPKFPPYSFNNYQVLCEIWGARYTAPPLGLMTVAALLPPEWEVRILDQNTTELRDADIDWADIVGTGGMFGQYEGAEEVARRSHERGKRVVVGGPDVTVRHDQYLWADYRVLGEAELTIPPFLEALTRGETNGRFESSERADMTKLAVVPRFDLVDPAQYLFSLVQYSRGCPYFCDFCEIPSLLGHKMRCKTPEQIHRELDAVIASGFVGRVEFVDDNFIGDKKQTKELLDTLPGWLERNRYPLVFTCQASCNVAADDELMRRLKAANFVHLFQGIESGDKETLKAIRKTQNVHVPFVAANEKILAHGMVVSAGFIVGFDQDTDDSVDVAVSLITRSHIVNVMLSRLFAIPGTPLHERLESEGRLEDLKVYESGKIDPTAIGLNFRTMRPKSTILRDYIKIAETLYSTDAYYARALSCCLHIRPSAKRILRAKEYVLMTRIFAQVCWRAGRKKLTRRHYWRLLAIVGFKNFKAIDSAVGFAACFEHFYEQSQYLIRTTREVLEHYESVEAEASRAQQEGELLASA